MCIVTFLLQMIDTDLLKRTHQTFGEREKKATNSRRPVSLLAVRTYNQTIKKKSNENAFCLNRQLVMWSWAHRDDASWLCNISGKTVKNSNAPQCKSIEQTSTQKHHQIFWQNRKMLWRRHKKLHTQTYTNTHTCSRFYLMRFISIKFICLLFLFHLFACSPVHHLMCVHLLFFML